jgi:hypothetical protein
LVSWTRESSLSPRPAEGPYRRPRNHPRKGCPEKLYMYECSIV